jgi:hypothetical protein
MNARYINDTVCDLLPHLPLLTALNIAYVADDR